MKLPIRLRFRGAAMSSPVLGLGIVCAFGPLASAEVDYVRSIKPLLKERCYSCHGALKQKGGLRLDTVELMRKGGESGAAVLPGKVEQSLIFERVTTTDETDLMPPKHEGERLNAIQLQTVRDWISEGARIVEGEKAERHPREHWAFRQRELPPVPSIGETGWGRNPVDAFVLAGLEADGLRPAPEAPREVLIRRLYLDLLGVPPSWKELQSALGTTETDWYEHLVELLLADPRHGERWARNWMDIWRFSDWWGLGKELRNSQKHMWHFRDWIVESLNGDTPYDEMLRLMLAADEIAPTDASKLRATGFLARNWFLFNRNTWLEETVEHVGKGFLGLTMNCAKCHDHKYDPISQMDFYRMRAIFEPHHVRMDIVPGESDVDKNGIPRAFDGELTAPTYRFERGEESKPDKSRPVDPDVPGFFREAALRVEPVVLPKAATEPERQPWVLDAHLEAAGKKLRDAQQAYAQADAQLAEARGSRSGDSTEASSTGTNAQGAPVPMALQEKLSALEVSTRTVAVAESALLSVQKRVEAIRAQWDALNPDAMTAARIAAVRADREAAVAEAAHALALQQAAIAKASPNQREAVEKKLKTAEAELEKARATAGKEPAPSDAFRPLPGTKWMATRFLNSAKDDPAIPLPNTSSGRRKALAGWITDARNPLTARVAANHLWGRHFGFYLAGTPFDVGRSGLMPTQPELLDWLASELVEHEWSMKHLHRVLVNSAAYRMSSSSKGREAELSRDPDNKKIWRRLPIRLEAEVIRDSLLSLSNTMDWSRGGPSIPASAQASSKRRSLYFFHSNNERNLFLTTFDGPMVKECYRREQSVVPQQALAMINGPLSQDASKAMVPLLEAELRESGMNSDADFVEAAFLYVTGMRPGAAAVQASLKAFEQWKTRAPVSTATALAREAFLWVLLNHNDFVTLR
jgi:hypothetical protein